jgi:hypothetical protein
LGREAIPSDFTERNRADGEEAQCEEENRKNAGGALEENERARYEP